MSPKTTLRRLTASVALVALLAACAGPVANGAFDEVADTTEQRIGKRPLWIKSEQDEQTVRETLDRLLAKPLTADDAVQVALLNNRRLQAGFAELGIGAADLTSAWRPANPGFTYGRLRGGGETEIERTVTLDALSLLVLPISAGIESRRYERTKLNTATEVLSLAARTQRAWYEAVAAEQIAKYAVEVREAADTQAELARRMKQVGNVSMLAYAREQLFYADTTARVARARIAAIAARERLGRLMGLWGRDMAFKLPERLPDIPKQPRDIDNIEATAIAERLDVRMARANVEATRKANGLTQATRFINVLETGFRQKSATGQDDKTGYEISIEVPIFDFGDAKATKAENIYMQSVNLLADTAITARSAAREAYTGYRTAYDLAQHYASHIIPLRQKVSEEMVLRYNGMLISTFELLADAREQIADVSAALEAQRDFWIADTDLTFVTIAPVDASGSPSSSGIVAARSGAAGH
jgi:hypothetical protein